MRWTYKTAYTCRVNEQHTPLEKYTKSRKGHVVMMHYRLAYYMQKFHTRPGFSRSHMKVIKEHKFLIHCVVFAQAC